MPLDAARTALERYVEVKVDDDGALTFRHGDVRAQCGLWSPPKDWRCSVSPAWSAGTSP